MEDGYLFSIFGIKNFLEGEFFSWYLDEWDTNIENVCKSIISRLMEYDIESLIQDPSLARDVLKILYEELIPRKEVRQKLGIYTTPDWLAELLIEETVKYGGVLDKKFLDPGAGTGTFLALVIRKIGVEGLKKSVPPRELLKMIVKNVIGFDIDALAVLTARTNYIMALASIGLLQHKGGESIEIPVYLANSIITPKELKGAREVDGHYISVVEIKAGGVIFHIPMRLLSKMTDILSVFKEYIEVKAPFGNKDLQEKISKYNITKQELVLLEEIYENLLEFKEKNIDTVWIPILKSYLTSIYYKDFDYVLGNPPWLAYRYIASPEYQEKIKELIRDTYGLVREEHLITHMEMATLFAVRCLDVFLKSEGYLGFVMPKSIFYADQHHNFRMYKVSNAKYKIEKLIDCEVVPLFHVPTCAIILKKTTEYQKKPKELDCMFVEGRLPEDRHKTISLNEALNQKFIKIKRGKLYLNLIGNRSYYGKFKLTLTIKKSGYYKHFYQGASIVPQTCWFIDIKSCTNDICIVSTSKRAKERAKIKELFEEEPIEKEFIYYILTGAEVLPFCHLESNKAVLPIEPLNKNFAIIRKENALESGKVNLVKWLNKAEKIWKKVRGEKRVDLYEWINWRNKLTRQNPFAKFKVVYLTSATHIAACVVDNTHYREETDLKQPVIIESTLYYYETNNEDEAYYLVAILNSTIIDELIKPFQAKGFDGAPRHIHKKPLEFNIPKYRVSNIIHKELAKLGRIATTKAKIVLPKILKELGYDSRLRKRGTLTPIEVANLRNKIRKGLIKEISQIDELVAKLFEVQKDNPRITIDNFFK